MTTLKGRLSPLPRAPSPNTVTGGPSNSQTQTRASLSSNRSYKKTEADFEAALLNPNKTIFLSGSPLLEDTPTLPSTPPRRHHDDAPLPVEKRSYEDDLRGLGISPVRGMQSPEVIPPTPARAVDKRLSQSTMRSVESGASTMSPGRASIGSSKKMGPSLGIDAELNEGHKSSRKPSSSKRRNIFRSPGTASSPDLATLVRKKKEAAATIITPTTDGASTSNANGNRYVYTSSRPNQSQSPSSSVPPPPPSVPSQQSVTSHASSSSGGPHAASRTVSGGSSDGWDRFSDLKSLSSGERMATISERPSRSRESSKEDSNKSMRNKAKGMFGRMFGASSSRESTPITSPATSTPRYSDTHPPPPVPPISAQYARANNGPEPVPSSPLPPIDTSETPQTFPPDAYQTPVMTAEEQFSTPPEHGRNSVTPTGRRPSEVSVTLLDKPLPPLLSDPAASSSSRLVPSGKTKSSLHVRHPASSAVDDSPPTQTSRRSSSSSSRRPSAMSFSDDIAGILNGIGTSDPARELGLPPESLRLRSRSPEPRHAQGRFPAELGRSTSNDTPRRGSKTKLLAPQPVAQRTSSLPSSPRSDHSPRAVQRTTSSPNPSPRPSISEESSLFPPQGVTRSGSSSSRRRTKTDPGLSPSMANPDLGVPLHVNDFGPEAENGDTTLRARHSSDLPPLSPASVRLVSSPPIRETSSYSLAPDPLTKSSFIHSGPWGRQPPSPRPSSTAPDHIEIVHTPTTPRRGSTGEEEDDEEKGRRLACEFLEDDYSSVPLEKVAEYLGGPRPVNSIALRYYMMYFNMKGQTLVESFRDLCAKLHLRAESQEIDRIIEAFSARYYECNPTTVFGSPGVVHTVTGAMLMLNTDLHIADLSKHMSRADFVRNSMRAIQESMPLDDRSSTPDLVRDDSGSVRMGSTISVGPSASSTRSRTAVAPVAHRSASAPVMSPQPQPPNRSESDRSVSATVSSLGDDKIRGSSTTVSSFSYSKAWESEAETALKDIFNQVRADKILLPISGTATPNSNTNSNRYSIISLGSDLGRNKTLRSPSGRSNDRVNALKRGSIRGMQSLMNNPYGSNFSSSDGRLSPTPSYATSINDSSTFAPTIGFASNLSHSVIKEHDDEAHSVDSRVSADTVDDELDDDELALLGAPWAKEGMLWKKSGGEGMVKKKSGKEWKQFFVVVQKGELLLFTFGAGSGGASFGAVGGGNWLNNANTAGRFSLVHATAANLPGGYSRDRPYVFTIHFPNAESIFLQAGTDDLVAEWINTCNYWSSRKSRPPLQGGVSNMEYGWSRVPDMSSLHQVISPDDDRASVRSGRSNMSKLGGTYGRRPISATPADRMHINDWQPPQPTLVASPLDEESQLEALVGYLRTVKDELESHKALEQPMMGLFTPGTKNAIKAHNNWNAKMRFLANEVARYEHYINSLRAAISLRIKKQGERRLERSLQRSTTSLHRRESEDVTAGIDDEDEEEDDDDEEIGVYERRSGEDGGLREKRSVARSLRIDSTGGVDPLELEGEGEIVTTPRRASKDDRGDKLMEIRMGGLM